MYMHVMYYHACYITSIVIARQWYQHVMFDLFAVAKKKHQTISSGNFLHGPIELFSRGAMSILCDRAEVGNLGLPAGGDPADPHEKLDGIFADFFLPYKINENCR